MAWFRIVVRSPGVPSCRALLLLWLLLFSLTWSFLPLVVLLPTPSSGLAIRPLDIELLFQLVVRMAAVCVHLVLISDSEARLR